MKKSKILFISYFFPPVQKSIPGVQRSIKFIRYLPIKEKYVITVRKNLYPSFIAIDNKVHLPIDNDTVFRTGTIEIFKYLLKVKFFFLTVFKKETICDRVDDLESKEETQKELLPPSKRGDLLTSLKDIISDFFSFPDYCSHWLIPAVWQGRKVVKKKKN